MSGLFLSLPLSLRRAENAAGMGWDLRASPPSRDDYMDAVVCFTCVISGVTVMGSIILAVAVAAAGSNGNTQFYEGALGLANFFLMTFVGCAFWPLVFVVVPLQLVDCASSPYPIIGAMVLGLTFVYATFHYITAWFLDALSLEAYHIPRWGRNMMKTNYPLLRARLQDAPLKRGAERRAAELLARYGT